MVVKIASHGEELEEEQYLVSAREFDLVSQRWHLQTRLYRSCGFLPPLARAFPGPALSSKDELRGMPRRKFLYPNLELHDAKVPLRAQKYQ